MSPVHANLVSLYTEKQSLAIAPYKEVKDMDRRKYLLLEALRAAALHAGEMRLYRRGKLPGLFLHRTRVNAEVARDAVREGFLEGVRVEVVGKVTIEWVRITQKGLDFLLESESPARALDELRSILALNQAGFPSWLADMHARLDDLTRRFSGEIDQVRRRLEQVAQQAEAALSRIAKAQVPTGVPWAQEALGVLERRGQVGLGDRCSLADLFAALKSQREDLTIRDFHDGLKRLQQGELLTLLPDVPNGDAPGPEYALLDGPALYYYVSRTFTHHAERNTPPRPAPPR